MARARHAMRVHPLRSKGVVVGVPVAAAVAFGAHSVLGVTPLSEQQDAPVATNAAPTAAPVQAYGLAATPPPATLDLLAAPTVPAEHGAAASSGSSGSSSAPAAGTSGTVTPIVADRGAAPTQVVPIAAPAPAPAAAPAPSMMTFSGGGGQQQAEPAPQQAAPHREAAPQQQAAESDGGSQQSSGGSLLGLDLGVAKVSVLSFGQ